jgi:hypothetical protein
MPLEPGPNAHPIGSFSTARQVSANRRKPDPGAPDMTDTQFDRQPFDTEPGDTD